MKQTGGDTQGPATTTFWPVPARLTSGTLAGIVALALALLVPATAQAQDRTGSVYLGVSYQKIALESDGLYDDVALQDTDSDYGFFAGLRFSRNFALEVDYARLGEFTYTGGGVTYKGYQVSGLMIAPVKPDLELFLRGGVGLVDVSQSQPAFDDTSTAFALGVGVDWTPRVLNGLTLRGFMTSRWITVNARSSGVDAQDDNHDQSLYEYGVGMAYNF